jgi:DNA polymerase-3 subunit gamma/tau
VNLPVKYRPKVFEEVIGQRHVTKTLANALRMDKISKAYLFSGPRGSGKTTVARLLAKGVNCGQGQTDHPCNECASCTSIDSSRSLDVIEIDGASNRGIEEIRNLRESIRFAPAASRYKIYIIDEVHMLTKEAFNALLKTLEEPPEHVIFVFATTEPTKVPDTVSSRTQRFDFKPLNDQEIQGRLELISNDEGIQAEEAALETIAHYSDGSMRDGIAILEQLSSYAPAKITLQDVSDLLGLIDREFFLNLFDLVREGQVKEVLREADRTFKGGYSAMEFVRGFQEAAGDLLRTKLGLGSALFEEFAKLLHRDEVLAYVRTGLDMEHAIRYSMRPRIWVDYHLARLAATEAVVDLTEVLKLSGVTSLGEYARAKSSPEEKELPLEGQEEPDARVIEEIIEEEEKPSPESNSEAESSVEEPMPEEEQGGEEGDEEPPKEAEPDTAKSDEVEDTGETETDEKTEEATRDDHQESESDKPKKTDAEKPVSEQGKKRLIELFDLEVIKDV